jgi:hypothetical protein
MTYSKNAARAHVMRVQSDRLFCGVKRGLVIALHRMDVGENRIREGRTRIEPDAAFGKVQRHSR